MKDSEGIVVGAATARDDVPSAFKVGAGRTRPLVSRPKTRWQRAAELEREQFPGDLNDSGTQDYLLPG